ncbi:alpha/beta-hydrolase [Rhizoctonia solani 123E]|uniref:Alpha/beta-hydrolase n=1 Tax=Rhizoctonia solani 123E TaxID=1423351 RepID=A0A074S9L0_9AGAM|nr:alpha/beta-hydrolase [Rhizoctonia solani 123E]
MASPNFTFAYNVDKGILADVYLPSTPRVSEIPVVVYWHGGGKLFHAVVDSLDSYLYYRAELCRSIVVSPSVVNYGDYKLLPPSTGHEILQDVLDLVTWVSSSSGLNTSLHQINDKRGIDTSRIIVAGTSAGGYLAYLAAIHARLEHPLRGVLSMYGMGGNLLTPHYLWRKTKPFFRGRPLLDPAQFEAFLNTAHPPPQTNGSTLEYGPDGIPISPRMFLTRVLLQEGTFLDYLTGDHGLSEGLRALDQPTINDVPQEHRSLFPEAGLSSGFPPTCLVHGTEDTAVLIGESKALSDRLRNPNVPCQLFEVEGAEHSFDYQDGHEAVLEQVFQVLQGWLK